MPDEFSRTELLLGSKAIEKLKLSKVAVFGIGGVGSYTVEGLVRAGIGSLILVDADKICLSNINRQLHATRKTVGKFKADVMRERVLEINPNASVEVIKKFYTAGDAEAFFEGCQIDYIVDAVDTVSAKIDLVLQAKRREVPIISCMGAGNKLDPTKFEVTDIYKTSVCPLAKVMRHELRQRGVKSLKVVYSAETPIMPVETNPKCTDRRHVPGSVSFVPSVAGLIMAGEVVKDLVSKIL
jgi:tRNA threonylcarbamoyladenosine dehydratase